jgi:outer membrane receptor protein involved in Fe transport
MKKSHRPMLLWSAAAASLMAGLGMTSAPAIAQEVSAEEDEAIVVTARRREEALQDVPISVTALSQDALQERQISSTSDLAAFTPGFQFNEAFGRDGDRPIIRGASNILISEGKVGVFLDGAPIVGDSSGIDLRSFSRIEVIRGPQAAVYGRGTESGAINYVSVRPGAAWEFLVEASSGTWERSEAYLSAMGPVLPNLGASISFRSYEFGGDYENTLGGQLGAQSTDTLNVALFFEPISNLSFDARYINSEDSDGHFAVQLIPGSANNCFLTTRPYNCGTLSVPESFAINTGDIRQPGLQRDTERYFFNGTWDIAGSGYAITYQYAGADQHEISGYDQSYDGRTFFIFNPPAFPTCASVPGSNKLCSVSPFNDTSGVFQESSAHELRLESPGDQRLRWRLGYFDLDVERTPDLSWLEITQSGGDSPGSIQETHSQAFFAGIDFDVTDRLTIGAEVRRQEDEIIDQGLSYRFGDVFPVPPVGIVASDPNQIVGNTLRRQAAFESTLPRITATYQLSDAINLYGQYAVGNSPGGFNPTDAPETTFDEETLTNFEIGFKTQLFGFN